MMKKILRSPTATMVLFSLAAVLLVAGTIGAVRAAPNLVSKAYGAQAELASIDTALVENDTVLDDGAVLLTDLLVRHNDEKFKVGKVYSEVLAVKNTGAIDEYVRVYVYKYWTDANGNKLPEMDPDLIHLTFDESSGWKIEDQTEERTVLYYTNPGSGDGTVAPDEVTNAFLTNIQIDKEVVATAAFDENGKYTFDYDGLQFHLEAVADAVQQHSGTDAMTGAWGRTN